MKLANKQKQNIVPTIGFSEIPKQKNKFNSLVNVWCFEWHTR